ncbi:hypothetical protein Zmor_009373 [Zophobas morio]|uniref:Uncharacterized protein n=1 Tax=Zophobas morio TaxID=2755281 RepID=A0AA38IQK6_9CUCU|nr:hypothetical protein Zmor_009373 [Zophobas morio]
MAYWNGVLALLLGGMVMAHPKEILVDEEGLVSPARKVAVMQVAQDEYVEDEAPCHLEYQVMKRVVGTCIKLGRSARGCVAGNYLHPLHPECM